LPFLKGLFAAGHYQNVNWLRSFVFLVATAAFADQATDRQEISRLIANLNDVSALLSAVAQSPAVEAQLKVLVKLRSTVDLRTNRPTVTISHEPWGRRRSIPPPALIQFPQGSSYPTSVA
jgi:hypothetical protein